jgi:hypothetical protein
MAVSIAPKDTSSTKASLPKEKWQEIYITQLSYLINLMLGMATGAVGFCISQLINHSDKTRVHISALIISSLLFVVSLFLGGACTALRLWIFDKRRAHPKYDKLRYLIICLVSIQSIVFVTAVLWLGIDVITYS